MDCNAEIWCAPKFLHDKLAKPKCTQYLVFYQTDRDLRVIDLGLGNLSPNVSAAKKPNCKVFQEFPLN